MAPRHARVVAVGGGDGAAVRRLRRKNVVMRFEAEIKTRDKARVKSYARGRRRRAYMNVVVCMRACFDALVAT